MYMCIASEKKFGKSLGIYSEYRFVLTQKN